MITKGYLLGPNPRGSGSVDLVQALYLTHLEKPQELACMGLDSQWFLTVGGVLRDIWGPAGAIGIQYVEAGCAKSSATCGTILHAEELFHPNANRTSF